MPGGVNTALLLDSAKTNSDISAEHIFNSVSLPLGILNEQAIIVYANPAFCSLCGSTRKELKGISIDTLVQRIKAPDAVCPDIISSIADKQARCEFPVNVSLSESGTQRIKLIIDPIRGNHARSSWKICTLLRIEETGGLPVSSLKKTENEYTCYRSAIERFRSLLQMHWWSPNLLCNTVVVMIADLFKTPFAGLCFIREGKVEHGARFQDGKLFQENMLPVSEHIVQLICKEHRLSIHYGDLHKQFPHFLNHISPQLTSLMGMPLIGNRGRVLGGLFIAARDNRLFDRIDMDIMEILGWYISFALENSAACLQPSPSHDSTLLHAVFSGLVHEVRNPLNGITALTEALQKDLSSVSDYQQYFSLIKEQTDRLSSLMQQLLVLGEPGSMVKCPFEMLIEICNEAVKDAEAASGEVINVRFLEPEENQALFLGDPRRLCFALSQIVCNALQHTKDTSEIIIDIGVSEKSMCVKVIDQGTGIVPEVQERIFEPFFTTLKKKNGLGLSIVRRIVESHGGTVFVRNNRYSKGCTAEIRIPILAEM